MLADEGAGKCEDFTEAEYRISVVKTQLLDLCQSISQKQNEVIAMIRARAASRVEMSIIITETTDLKIQCQNLKDQSLSLDEEITSYREKATSSMSLLKADNEERSLILARDKISSSIRAIELQVHDNDEKILSLLANIEELNTAIRECNLKELVGKRNHLIIALQNLDNEIAIARGQFGPGLFAGILHSNVTGTCLACEHLPASTI